MNNKTIYIDKEQFSKRLQELFKNSNCKAIELENSLEVTRVTVSRWRNGFTLPNNSQIKEIARFFGVRYEWLIGRDEYKTIKGIPFKKLFETYDKREAYIKSLGYQIDIGKFGSEYREDDPETGEPIFEPVIETYIITRDNMTIEISSDEFLKLEKEIDSFVDFSFSKLFK